MSKNLGSKFWDGITNCLVGIDTWKDNFKNAERVDKWLNDIEKSTSTNADKEILETLRVYSRNNEFAEPYFKEEIMNRVSELYKK